MRYPDFLIDKRVVQRNLRKGSVDAKDWQKVLTELPDVADNAEISAPETASEEDEGGEE
jgi:hypothetical protein